jgi:3-dehydroquinate dehydratase-2
MKKIAILNGPNLDRLGKREPEVYGTASLADLEAFVRAAVDAKDVELEFFQSNSEGGLIDRISSLADRKFDGFILNPGGLSHTSIALRDSIAGSGMPAVEVHISNIYKREPFRHTSMTAGACAGVISGLGFAGYTFALQYLLARK